MQNFQDTFETRKQSFISAFSICSAFWTLGRADRGPINPVPSVRPYVRPRRAILENASFNSSETWHEVRVP